MFIFRATSSYFLSVHDLVLTALCPVHRLLQVVLHHVHLPRNLFILPLCIHCKIFCFLQLIFQLFNLVLPGHGFPLQVFPHAVRLVGHHADP